MINFLKAVAIISMIAFIPYRIYCFFNNPKKLYFRRSGKFFDWRQKIFIIWILGCFFYPYIFDWDTYLASLPWQFGFLGAFLVFLYSNIIF